ncbi:MULTISPECIES: NUDIX domain-containing protein [unclassified Neptuniibacter]|uniref:NUDIX domain-containing protein n=1 Tax=unclassified Neptuniibacter TaxID=2630693 RepID=UPI000C692C97|nr:MULTISPECIES: NUDIX domain-containing protein [unclassified Neptuniibacter]MAY43042.1 ADP-ribose diphosphatase [Oceanospirillaceae bacterium]|tara:strand:- start:24133 stop:24783 length:651 start_codon:yes stop_codon:yes gene_type:complete
MSEQTKIAPSTSELWRSTFSQKDFSIDKQESLYDGFFKMLKLHLTHKTFAGGEISIQRELFYRDDAVCVLLYDAVKQAVVLVEQFRVGTYDNPKGPWLLELVAGIVEKGETPEDVARRESVEEAGAELGEVVSISRFVPSSGGTREYIDLLCANVDSSGVEGLHGLAEEGEDIKVHTLPVNDAFELVKNGTINNAPAIIAIQWLQINKSELDKRWT